MELDDELCLCFHVTKRKVINFLKLEKPQRPSQLSECFGAGTGCGWCCPFLRRLWEQANSNGDSPDPHLDATADTKNQNLPDSQAYQQQRAGYLKLRKDDKSSD